MTPDMTLALPTLPCRHCDTVAVPTLGPGAGQHVARALCSGCGAFLKWLPRALIEGKDRMGCLNRVILCGAVSKYGVTVKYANNGTPCASFALELHEQGPDGRDHTTYIDCECWGKKAEGASEIEPGQMVLFEGRLRKRPKGEQWEMVVSGFEVSPLRASAEGRT